MTSTSLARQDIRNRLIRRTTGARENVLTGIGDIRPTSIRSSDLVSSDLIVLILAKTEYPEVSGESC